MAAGVRLRLHTARLTDRDIWRCAREALTVHRSVLVELSSGDYSGWGEVPAYRVTTFASSVAVTLGRRSEVEQLLGTYDPRQPGDLPARLRGLRQAVPFLAAAVEVAACDLAARLAGQPLWAFLGLQDPTGRSTSFSIGLDEPEIMRQKLAGEPSWTLYKIKLASPTDLDLLATLRTVTGAPFWIDGNASWAPGAVLPVLDELQDLGVVAIEQPYPVEAVDDQRQLRHRSPIPLFADESVSKEADLTGAMELFDGINVKVLKAGGLLAARRMLRRARASGRQTMLGCLPESSAGASAAAHMGAIADHVDIDTIALLSEDTGSGATLDDRGRLTVPVQPGSGFVPAWASSAWEELDDGRSSHE